MINKFRKGQGLRKRNCFSKKAQTDKHKANLSISLKISHRERKHGQIIIKALLKKYGLEHASQLLDILGVKDLINIHDFV